MARTWIFQGNPDKFDIDGYLATHPERIVWQVNQHSSEIAPGDKVYIWRSGAGEKGGGGVCGEGRVLSSPMTMPDDAQAKPFWRDKSAAGGDRRLRVELEVLRIANKKQILRRDWLSEDPVLRDLPILSMASGTNFPVPEPLTARLADIWAHTGFDWTRAESLAGLWAYVETLNKPISRLPGSPVANVAVLIGRATSGVYNKVMNFRSLDSTDERKGMDGASNVDRAVWAEFLDPASGAIDAARVRKAFATEWGPAPFAATKAALPRSESNDSPSALSAQALEQLLAAHARRLLKRATLKPTRREVMTTQFERDPYVVAITKRTANFRCEVEDCASPIFFDGDGLRYCEVHHLVPLAKDGDDSLENAVCLCPVHHREIHFGANASALRDKLRTKKKMVSAKLPKTTTQKAEAL